VLSPAVDEIAQAAEWFDSQRTGLGVEFWDAVDAAISRVEEAPLGFAKSEFAKPDTDIRFAIVARFHFVIHFLIEPNEVQILSVAHAGRRPGYWLGRVKKS
jgi:hypothetical protein